MGLKLPSINLPSVGDAWNDATHPFNGNNNDQTWANILGGGPIPGPGSILTKWGYDATTNLLSGQQPSIQTPGHVPTQGEANETALGQELQTEKNMRSSWNILTGGEGVLDTPRTAGPTLLGS